MSFVEMKTDTGGAAYLVDPVTDPDGTVLHNIQLLLPDNETLAISIEVTFIRTDPNAPVDEPQPMEHDQIKIYPFFVNGTALDPFVVLHFYPGHNEVYMSHVHPELEGKGWVTFEYKEG